VKPNESLTLVEYFLEIDGIKGESQDPTHKDWIDIQSYGFQTTNTTKPTGTKKGRSNLGPISFTKVLDASSPALFLYCSTGKHIIKAVLSMRASNAKSDFLTITFGRLVVSRYEQSAGASETPTEQITLNYAKIKFE
jgi:type VI secretion system secreted protein Hcp